MALLKVSDIRPDEVGLSNAVQHDIEWFSARKGDFVHVPCPVCGGKDADTVSCKNGFTFLRCVECKTWYIAYRPTRELLAEFARTGHELNEAFSKNMFPASQDNRVQLIYTPRLQELLNKCRQFGQTGGVYLEIGAGFGTFASMVQQSGVFSRVIAVEPGGSLAEDCRSKGLEVLEMVGEMVPENIRANVVASFEVIEHVFSPAEFLGTIWRLLEKNGLFIFSTPNGLGFDVLELDGDATALGLGHFNVYNPKSIALLLERCGFDVLDIATPGQLDVNLVQTAWASKGAPKGGFLHHLLCEASETVAANFQKFLCENLLSSHMVVVAQKNTTQNRTD